MPLWSLTQERVEKLLRQIGDKEMEIDILIKLSKEDIWKQDLKDFIAEWRFQLDEENRRERKVAGMGRRASSKLMIATRGPGKKRKAGDDDDDDYSAPKSKKAATKKAQPPKGALLDFLQKASPRAEKTIGHDGTADLDDDMDDFEAEVLPKKSRAAPKPKPKPAPKKEDDDVEEVSAVKAAPKAKSQSTAANRKAVDYVESSDSDDNGDDLLNDVSKMVKGIGDANGKALISDFSRPGTSAGLRTASSKAPKVTSDFDPDETDYSKLVPQQSPRRSLLVKQKDVKVADEDDDDEDDDGFIKPAAPKAKTTAKAKPAAASTAKSTAAKTRGRPKKDASKDAPAPAAKKAQPAAKPKGKKKIVDDLSDDDIDAMANDILDSPAGAKSDDDDDEPLAAARPSRRAAATARKPTYAIDDDDSEMDEPAGDDSADDFDDSE